MSKLVIWGASGYALVVADIVRRLGGFELLGYLDDVDLSRRGESFGGAQILGGQEAFAVLAATARPAVIVAIGDCEARVRIGRMVVAHGLRLVTAVHPSAIVADGVELGAGTVVAAGAVIGASARIGASVIINTSASVDHECVIAEGVHIGPGAHLGGLVTVGESSWIGIGSTVRDRIVIGARAVVGAGAVVVKDVPADVVAYGVPCEVVRRGPGKE